jgi:predicted ester cyclase
MKNLLLLLFILGLFSSCSNMGNMNSSHNREAFNKARTQQFYDQVFNAHNLNMIDSFCVAEFVDHTPNSGHSGKGIADLKADLKDFMTAFPDIHLSTNFMVAQGDTVVAYITMTGTNSGAMGPNMPATNKKMTVSGIDIISVKGRKAVERWGFFDTQKMMDDLGMGAPPPPAAEPAKPMEPAKQMAPAKTTATTKPAEKPKTPQKK